MYKRVLFANINKEQVLLNGCLIKSGLNISFFIKYMYIIKTVGDW